MSPNAWRSVLDAWRRGGAGEVMRAVRGRAELRRLSAMDPDAAYRSWLSDHDQLWTRHAAKDPDEAVRLVVEDDPEGLTSAPAGSFIVGLGTTDVLRPGALHLLGSAIREGADVVYADEDVETDSGPGQPFLKPAWSESLALTIPGAFPGCPTAISAPLWNRVLEEASGPDAVDDSWTDLVLRATEHADRITHLPLPLATRGRAAVSDTGDTAAVQAALVRRRIMARTEPGAIDGTVRVIPEATASRVSVLIPTRDQPDLVTAIADALERESALHPIERIWLDHATTEPQARARLDAEADRPHSRVLRFDGDFNFSRMINAGAQVATGRHLLLLNNDVEPTAEGWIRDLAADLSLPGVSAAGPLLLYPDGTVQHAGVGLGIGTVTGHLFRGMSPGSMTVCGGPLVAREVSAVTGACLMVKRAVFEAAGGLDETHLPVSFSDVDFCLKLRSSGARILYDPAVQLIHHETVSRSPILDPQEVSFMRERWGAELLADPYLPPALSRLSERPLLARRFDAAAPRTWTRP